MYSLFRWVQKKDLSFSTYQLAFSFFFQDISYAVLWPLDSHWFQWKHACTSAGRSWQDLQCQIKIYYHRGARKQWKIYRCIGNRAGQHSGEICSCHDLQVWNILPPFRFWLNLDIHTHGECCLSSHCFFCLEPHHLTRVLLSSPCPVFRVLSSATVRFVRPVAPRFACREEAGSRAPSKPGLSSSRSNFSWFCFLSYYYLVRRHSHCRNFLETFATLERGCLERLFTAV